MKAGRDRGAPLADQAWGSPGWQPVPAPVP